MTNRRSLSRELSPRPGWRRRGDFCEADVWGELLPPTADAALKKRVASCEGLLSLLTELTGCGSVDLRRG